MVNFLIQGLNPGCPVNATSNSGATFNDVESKNGNVLYE